MRSRFVDEVFVAINGQQYDTTCGAPWSGTPDEAQRVCPHDGTALTRIGEDVSEQLDIGPADAHVEKLRELEKLGVDHFGIYLMHDAQEATLAAYGRDAIPALQQSAHPTQ